MGGEFLQIKETSVDIYFQLMMSSSMWPKSD